MVYNDPDLLFDVNCDAIRKFDETKDVQGVFDAIVTVVHMSYVGRREGLLALEEKFVNNPAPDNIDVTRMVILVVDGTDPEIVGEILRNMYLANKYEGNEALAQYVLMRGTLMIQAGMNPRIIEEILKSLLPKTLYDECSNYIKVKQDSWKQEDDLKIMNRFKSWEPIEVETEELKKHIQEVETLVLKLDDHALQRVMRDTDNEHIRYCAAVFSDKGRDFIFRNMSDRLRLMTMEGLIYMKKWSAWRSDDDISDAIEKVEEIIYRLECNGEIVLKH